MPRCASAWRATSPPCDRAAVSEWWTYTPADFLMFAPRIYWRLFEALNRGTWPAAVLAPLAGLAWLAWVQREAARPGPRAATLAAVGLALAWAASALAFLKPLLAPIHWPADHVVPWFVVQAALLLVMAAAGGLRAAPWAVQRRAGLVLLGYALLLHPLWPLLDGRPWRQAEVFGLAPDPTAIATLGVLQLLQATTPSRRWLCRAAWALPLGWCVLSAATLWTMGSAQGGAPAGAVVLALLARGRRSL